MGRLFTTPTASPTQRPSAFFGRRRSRHFESQLNLIEAAAAAADQFSEGREHPGNQWCGSGTGVLLSEEHSGASPAPPHHCNPVVNQHTTTHKAAACAPFFYDSISSHTEQCLRTQGTRRRALPRRDALLQRDLRARNALLLALLRTRRELLPARVASVRLGARERHTRSLRC